MAQSAVLKAQKRTEFGTRISRALRDEGRIPANIQGGEIHLDFSLEEQGFLATRRQHVHLYDIEIEGESEVETAVVRELQWDTFGDRIIHVEFKKVIRGVETESDVKIEFYGHPESGILNLLLAEIGIRCLPSKIPHSLRVRIGERCEGDHILASDLEMPEGVFLDVEPETEIATIVQAKIHIEPTSETEGEGEEGIEGEGAETDGADDSDKGGES
jgi:large subunit ribosomal protein L25